jgi:hypothetical protein
MLTPSAFTLTADSARININTTPATSGADLVLRGAGVDRWFFHKEGSGAGEDLGIYKDSLTVANRVLRISRATGAIDSTQPTPTLALNNSSGNGRCTLRFGATDGASFHIFRNAGASNLSFAYVNPTGVETYAFNIGTNGRSNYSNLISFWAATPPVAPPINNGTSTGTRLQLYGANDSFAIGIEGGSMWFNASNTFHFYTGGTRRMYLQADRFDVGNQWITSLRDPGGTATDAANKRYVDAQRDTRVAKTGDTMTGNLRLDMGNNQVGIRLRKNNRDANTSCPSIVWSNSKSDTAIGQIVCVQEAQWYAYQDYSRVEFWCGSGIQRRTMWGTGNDLNVASRVLANGVVLTSDANKKMDIAPADEREAIAAFDKLKPIRFRWKPEMVDDPLSVTGKSQAPHPDPQRRHWGFVAQDVEAAAPDLVHTSKDEGKGIDLGGLVAMMAAKIQSLEARLAANGL